MLLCRNGGIGKRSGLKIRRWKHLESSSLSSGTRISAPAFAAGAFFCALHPQEGALQRGTGGLSSGKSSAGIFLFMFRKACRPCRLRERTAGPDAQLGGENSPFLPLKRRAFSACSAFFGKWPGIVMLPRVREEMGVRFSCFTGEKAGTSVVPVWAGGLFTVSSFLYHARKS